MMVDNLKPGDRVIMIDCLEAEKYKDKVWTVRSKPWKLGCGEEVVLLDNKAGGFATSCLQKVQVMTLDDAIILAEQEAAALGNCDCGREHAQLAKWLTELRDVRKNPVTSITVTPRVKELRDLLEPDIKLTAVLDNGRAIVTDTSIKLNILLHTLHRYMNEGALSINELRRVYERVASTELLDLTSYLNTLETAARDMTNACIDWWCSGKEMPEYKRFTDTVVRMSAILGHADATRRTKEEKGLQVKIP